MFKNGDNVIVVEQGNGKYYKVGAKGRVIEDYDQDSLLVEFYEGDYNKAVDGKWYASSRRLALLEEEVSEKESSLEEEFNTWIDNNPHFWDMFVLFSNQLIACGATKSSAWLVCNRIRWETAIKTQGNPYKISNDFIALLSRKFMAEYPQHAGFFTIKEMKRK